MLLGVTLLAVFLVLGLAVRRAFPGDAHRRYAWTSYFWTLTPLLVFTAFSTVPFDPEIALALASAIVASWLVIGIGYAYAALVAVDRGERGALALAAGFPTRASSATRPPRSPSGTRASR